MGWIRLVGCIGSWEIWPTTYSTFVDKPQTKKHVIYLGLKGKVVLKWFLGKQGVKERPEFTRIGISSNRTPFLIL
jgi:hypothetical protein